VTTVLADARLGLIVADSNVTDDDRVWSDKKVFRYKGVIYGFAGLVEERIAFMDWLKGGPEPKFATSSCLALSPDGLFVYDNGTVPAKVTKGYEAIGTGAKAAMCAYEALGFTDPVRAVKIVCKYDAGSRTPVRVYKLCKK